MKTGNTTCVPTRQAPHKPASMEPGHEDREYLVVGEYGPCSSQAPQWSPVMKTGNTTITMAGNLTADPPQWSPVMKTGNTQAGRLTPASQAVPQWSPVMKTGNTPSTAARWRLICSPQWSPVMKTGNTVPIRNGGGAEPDASMEPGHEDREYGDPVRERRGQGAASMEPGHEDREYFQVPYVFKTLFRPQWSPVMKTGNTSARLLMRKEEPWPQWSPVMKTGNTARLLRCRWLPVLHTLARTATRHPQPMGGSAGRVDKNQP